MTQIRALEVADLPAVADLYAELDGLPQGRPTSGYQDFFRRTLLESPLADPKLPTWVYEDSGDGVVGVIGAHPRRYLFGEREVLLACAGPLIIHPKHRPRGLGGLLLRRFAGGAQDVSFSDRSIEEVHQMWRLLGGATDTGAAIEWYRVLAPAGYANKALARRLTGRAAPPGGAAAAAVDGVIGRRRRPPRPASGRSARLEPEALIELVAGQRRHFPLRPAYTVEYLEAVFETMAMTVLGDQVVRRIVHDDGGRAIGAYVMIVARHGSAHVLEVFAPFPTAGIVMEHLLHDAAEAGAVEVSGRVEPVLLSHLGRLRCGLRPAQWATLLSSDSGLLDAALGGRSMISRMDGEWWMRPRNTLG